MIFHWLGFAALILVARFVFLFFAAAVCDCRWCKPASRWCLRCRGERQHFRIGARWAARVRLAAADAIREWRASR